MMSRWPPGSMAAASLRPSPLRSAITTSPRATFGTSYGMGGPSARGPGGHGGGLFPVESALQAKAVARPASRGDHGEGRGANAGHGSLLRHGQVRQGIDGTGRA